MRWHCPPDTGFEILALAVWGRAGYFSATWAPHNTEFHTWIGKKHFCFCQTVKTGNRTLAWKAAVLATTLSPDLRLSKKAALTTAPEPPPTDIGLLLHASFDCLFWECSCSWHRFYGLLFYIDVVSRHLATLTPYVGSESRIRSSQPAMWCCSHCPSCLLYGGPCTMPLIST